MVFVNEQLYKNKIGIYRIRNVVTNVSYIGQTRKSFRKRFFNHRSKLRKGEHDNPWLQASFNKHGEDAFEFSVVETVSNPEIINDLEIYYIMKEKESGKCFNMADGGGGRKGMPLSQERRKELGELNRRLNTGKKASEETRRKMSETRKSIKRSKEIFDKAVETKSKAYLKGAKNKLTKISAEDAREIKIAIMNNVSYERLAEKYNISYSNINAIRSNRSWKFVKVEGWEEYCITNRKNRRARQSRSAN